MKLRIDQRGRPAPAEQITVCLFVGKTQVLFDLNDDAALVQLGRTIRAAFANGIVPIITRAK